MSLDQERAKLAFKHITKVKETSDDRKKKYASMVHGLPALLRSAGLSQALHFVESRSEDQKKLVEHLAEQLRRIDVSINDNASLLAKVRDADLSLYLRLTHEALACANWYRRFVQGELGIDGGDDNGQR